MVPEEAPRPQEATDFPATGVNSLASFTQRGTARGIDALVPFCGDGHYHYCFDYRKHGPEGEPAVTYIDVECFDKDERLAPNGIRLLKDHRL